MNKNNHFHLLGAVIATGILSFSGVLIETAMNVTFPTLINEFGLSTSKNTMGNDDLSACDCDYDSALFLF